MSALVAHEKKLEINAAVKAATYNVVVNRGQYVAKTYIPVITTYQWVASYPGVGDGRSICNNDYSYYNGCYNSYNASSIWCNFKLNGGVGGMISYLRYHFATDGTNYRKKAKYITLYRYKDGVYTLIQQFTTSSPVADARSYEDLTLTEPYTFTGECEFRLVVATPWADNYMWCTEVQVMGYILT